MKKLLSFYGNERDVYQFFEILLKIWTESIYTYTYIHIYIYTHIYIYINQLSIWINNFNLHTIRLNFVRITLTIKVTPGFKITIFNETMF